MMPVFNPMLRSDTLIHVNSYKLICKFEIQQW
jgi:hypothetical protein